MKYPFFVPKLSKSGIIKIFVCYGKKGQFFVWKVDFYKDFKISKAKKFLIFSLSVSSLFVIGYANYLVGYEWCFTLFYVLSVSYSAWLLGRKQGYFIAILATFVWLFSDFAAGHIYKSLSLIFWNFGMRLFIFLLAAHFLSKTKDLLNTEKELSRIDYLTNLRNSRSFAEYLKTEIEKYNRFKRPFSVVYMDIDDFKKVNDMYGHPSGDETLKLLGKKMSESVRTTDIVARLGGDEFGLIFPETSSGKSEEILKRLIEKLSAFADRKKIPVSFSFGMVSIENTLVSEDAAHLMKIADELMYCGKKNGKNQIKAVVY